MTDWKDIKLTCKMFTGFEMWIERIISDMYDDWNLRNVDFVITSLSHALTGIKMKSEFNDYQIRIQLLEHLFKDYLINANIGNYRDYYIIGQEMVFMEIKE